MASEAFAGVGTKFQRWDGAAWQDIAEVNSIDGPGMTKDVLEVTSLDTDAGYNEFITGFAEGGTLTLDMNFTRETYELMKEDFESDEVRSYRIQLPDYDSEPSTFTIEGLVIELPITMTADDKVTADVVIQITSQVVLDVGSTVPAEESEIPPEESSEAPPASSEDVPNLSELMVILDDGNTLLAYDHNLDVTLEDTDKVGVWLSQFDSAGMALEQLLSDGTRPTKVSNGIQFDGGDDCLQTGLFNPISGACTFYIVFKINSFVAYARILDLSHSEVLNIQVGAYDYRISLVGSASIGVTDKHYDGTTFNIVKAVVNNGVNSSLRVNRGSGTATGDIGTRMPRYFTAGGRYAGSNMFTGIISAIIVRQGAEADGTAVDDAIFQHYNNNYVHFPTSAVVEDAAPTKVILRWDEPIDTDTIGVASDYVVQNRSIASVAALPDGYGVEITLNIAIDQAYTGYAGVADAASGGGLLTASGASIPFSHIPITNNVID